MRMRKGRPAYHGPGHHGQHRKDQGRGHVARAPPVADSRWMSPDHPMSRSFAPALQAAIDTLQGYAESVKRDAMPSRAAKPRGLTRRLT